MASGHYVTTSLQKDMATPLEQQSLALDALGNPVRRRLLALVAERPRHVNELAAEFDISRPAISRHLAQLQAAGFLTHMPDGTRNVYQIDTAGFALTRNWLDAFWTEAEARLKLVAHNTSENDRD